jgi:lipoprotein-anchoring transpeptidase ErfK/SrfK
MSRVRMRASRALVVFLVLSLIIVILVAKSRRPAAPLPSAQLMAATPASPNGEHPRPLLVLASNVTAPSAGPTTLPTTQPIAIAPTTQPLASAPTTRPIVIAPAGEIVVTPPIGEARSRLANDPLAARRILNDELAAGHLSGAELEEARELLIKANEQLVFSPRVFRDDPNISTYNVQSGDKLMKIAAAYGVTWDFLARINNISDARRIRAGQPIKIVRGPFHAVVSKHSFTMDIYLGAPGGVGSTFVTSYRVGLGKDDSTPLGTWKATGKLKNPAYYSPRGEGIIAADDPKNPLGEYWIGLMGIDGTAVGKNSYGIHGTIDPASIGREESMGCIRMRNEDVAIVYELLVEGKSTIVVKE